MRDDSPRRLRVLVVDDELLIRWSVAETLLGLDAVVFEAPDGKTAIQTLTEAAPVDVVLLDYRLPDSNDLTLLTTIRRLTPRTRIILMTALGTMDVVEDAMALGAYRVINKPFELHDLAALVMHVPDSGDTR